MLENWPPRIANWLPKLDDNLFSNWMISFSQHLLISSLGQILFLFFSYFSP
jgi:hypothetical protein